jgi:hypothetical protein
MLRLCYNSGVCKTIPGEAEMSLILSGPGTTPEGLVVTTSLDGTKVYVGAYCITMEDFLVMAAYALGNTDLLPNDPRIEFVRRAALLFSVEGFNPGGKRLQFTKEQADSAHI